MYIRKYMKHFLFSLLLIAGALHAEPAAAALEKTAKIDSVLASVNGEPITLLDVLLETSEEESKLALRFSGELLNNNIMECRKKVVEELILRKLVYIQYKANPFDIRRQDIELMVDQVAAHIGDGTRESLERRVKSSGMTMEDIRQKAKEKLIVGMFLYKNCDRMVHITPKTVYETYQADPEKWSRPARISIQLLQVRRDDPDLDVEKIVKNLQDMLQNTDSETFGKIVKENTHGPNAARGGDMGEIDRDKLRPEFAAALTDAKAGSIVGPVETPEAFYFIRVNSVSEREEIPFETVSAEIERTLREKAVAERRAKYTEILRQDAIIRYFF